MRRAFAMLSDPRTARAFAVGEEPPAVRQRYGSHKFGQSLLLARRLIEADVPLVTVNWDDETATDKVSPFWDTHDHNFPALRDRARASLRSGVFGLFGGPPRARPARDAHWWSSPVSSAGRLGLASSCRTR